MGLTFAEATSLEIIQKAIRRGVIAISGERITYHLGHKRSYAWTNPEEWVRAYAVAMLVLEKDYPPSRIRLEVKVPRRTPSDRADVVVYADDELKAPFLVVECKADQQGKADRKQAIEQLFGNANSLRADIGLYEEYGHSIMFDVRNYVADERAANIKGTRTAVPIQYGKAPKYALIAGSTTDIQPAKPRVLETKIRRTHSAIWAGGKRDPLNAFDEWSKLLFAKVFDERNTANGKPRGFQVGTDESPTAVASRIHDLFDRASRDDRSIFPDGIRIELPDRKIFEVVKTLQDISITDTKADTIGAAFESFFGSVFRGELGQYFTMRQIARFTVAMLGITKDHYVIDPTAGSGGFLLEVLLQVWHGLDDAFEGRKELDRYKNDFALHKVYGIEIHPILARICKINLLLHHDGHTNIEGDRSCLDSTFTKNRLTSFSGQFTRVVGNPPFGDQVEEGDEDLLGANRLSNFQVAEGRSGVPSEHAILERSIALLEGGGMLGFVLPDGLFNNQGELSNCPRMRRYLASHGYIEAIVSLPDFAFRRSGAQNKTSILFFKKFTLAEKARFDAAGVGLEDEEERIIKGLVAISYHVFLAEARHIGYTTTGISTHQNDLYRGSEGGRVDVDQKGTILGEFHSMSEDPEGYAGFLGPDCMSISVVDLWKAHASHRLDPKYYLFKHSEKAQIPSGWVTASIGDVMRRRLKEVAPEKNPDAAVKVMTISQTGDVRPRAAGKGNNPPEWLGMYFEDTPSTWYEAKTGDVVFSSIDLWKGCITVTPPDMDGALVTKEFPIYEIVDERLSPEFLATLLRCRYYQRAFRAITTGHSNRRRTQTEDFEALSISFPPERAEQASLIAGVVGAKSDQRNAAENLRTALLALSDKIDGRGNEELPEIADDPDEAVE